MAALTLAIALPTGATSISDPPPFGFHVEPALYRGHTAAEWAAKFRHRTRQLQVARVATKTLRRTLLHRPATVEAINLACAIYGWCSTLWSLARCESGLNPGARNPSGATGLFQILHPSTWRTTPFGRFDVYSPYANALAAGYMLAHGRRGEWVC